MAYVLRTWLCNPAVVTVEECNSGGAKRVHLRVDTGPRKIIIDIVCHRPARSPDTGQSVAANLLVTWFVSWRTTPLRTPGSSCGW